MGWARPAVRSLHPPVCPSGRRWDKTECQEQLLMQPAGRKAVVRAEGRAPPDDPHPWTRGEATHPLLYAHAPWLCSCPIGTRAMFGNAVREGPELVWTSSFIEYSIATCQSSIMALIDFIAANVYEGSDSLSSLSTRQRTPCFQLIGLSTIVTL